MTLTKGDQAKDPIFRMLMNIKNKCITLGNGILHRRAYTKMLERYRAIIKLRGVWIAHRNMMINH